MVEVKIGKKTYEMKLVSWDFGSALLPLKEDETAAETSPTQKIIGVRHGDGKILRQFPSRVQPAAFDRRRLA